MLTLQQCQVVPCMYINHANQAPGFQTGHACQGLLIGKLEKYFSPRP